MACNKILGIYLVIRNVNVLYIEKRKRGRLLVSMGRFQYFDGEIFVWVPLVPSGKG